MQLFIICTVFIVLAGCSPAKQASQEASASSSAPTSLPVPLVTASPTPTQSAEDTKRFEKITAEIEESNRKLEEKLHENEMELQKDKYCVIQEQAVQYGQPLSEQCKKRLANLQQEASKASQDKTPPDDSWLDKP